MTDETGNQVWSIVYSVFGETITIDSTITNNLRFAGQYYDEESGFHYNWFRYYLPETGRYLTQDPINFSSKDTNLYRYVFNNPINYTDPLGLLVAKICASGKASVGLGAKGSICYLRDNKGNQGVEICTGVSVGGGRGVSGSIEFSGGDLEEKKRYESKISIEGEIGDYSGSVDLYKSRGDREVTVESPTPFPGVSIPVSYIYAKCKLEPKVKIAPPSPPSLSIVGCHQYVW